MWFFCYLGYSRCISGRWCVRAREAKFSSWTATSPRPLSSSWLWASSLSSTPCWQPSSTCSTRRSTWKTTEVHLWSVRFFLWLPPSFPLRPQILTDSFVQDFVVTVIFSTVWLISSCCWAKALSDIKRETDPTHVALLLSACRAQENKCSVTQEPLWSRLNTSVVGVRREKLWKYITKNKTKRS